jgi:hypothetical protein
MLPSVGFRRRTLFGAMGCVFLLLGCGGSTKQELVEGKVFQKGAAAVGVVVTFHPIAGKPGDPVPSGVTDDHGVFKLSTAKGVGAPIGKYGVSLVWPPEQKFALGGQGKKAGAEIIPDRLNGKYDTAAKSKLEFEVKPGPNQVPQINVD